VARFSTWTKFSKESVDLVMKLPRKTDELVGNIPEETNKYCCKGEGLVTLFFMPRDTQTLNVSKHFRMVIVI